MRRIILLGLVALSLVACKSNKKKDTISLSKEEQEKNILYEKYKDNSLNTGATPYADCYGGNSSCSSFGCSQIKVKTPNNSDVVVFIKRNRKVVRHAYIRKDNTYTFEVPNGVYQPFFYYGVGWNPNQEIKNTKCGMVKGGFVADEDIGKDTTQILNNNVLTYELILQKNGNFRTKRSNKKEIFN